AVVHRGHVGVALGLRHLAGGVHHLLAPTMACHSPFAAGLAPFLAGPLMGGALLVRRLAALARDLPLLGAVHRGKSAILFCHSVLPDPPHARCLMSAHRRLTRGSSLARWP